jgi:predicted PurR-regulated permease PerM
MMGFDRRAARAAWTVGLVALALYMAYALRHTVFIFVLAIFFSYMLYPLVRWCDRFTPRRVSHTASTVAVYVLLVLAIGALGALIGPLVADKASKLANQLPELVRDPNLASRLPLPGWLSPYQLRIVEFLHAQFDAGTALAVPMARKVGEIMLVVVSNSLFVVLVPILAFLFIKDGASIRERYMLWARASRYPAMWSGIADDLDVLVGRYMRALLILALAAVVAYGTCFTLLGVPYGLLLASVAGAMEFVPVLGPLAAAVVILAVAGLSGYAHLLWLVGFIALYRVVQDYVLNPYLMSDGVSLPPLLVLFGLLAGEELGGVAGIFLSVPLLAAAKILLIRIVQAKRAPQRAGLPPAAAARRVDQALDASSLTPPAENRVPAAPHEVDAAG